MIQGMRIKPVVLFRKSLAEEGEFLVAKSFFDVVENRAEVRKFVQYYLHDGTIVVPRYSALPYYEELEADVLEQGATLINSYRQHRYVADMQDWWYDFQPLTPKTWFRLEDVPTSAEGSFVLKGATNSRKGLWKTHMFAETRKDVIDVYCKLMDDSMMSSQRIYVREFEPFQSVGTGINGCPITREFRFFILDGVILAHGFYWSEHAEDAEVVTPGFTQGAPVAWVEENICPRLKGNIRFAVADVAQHVDGRWRLVELNDGSMSGLSCVDPIVLYSNLAQRLQ